MRGFKVPFSKRLYIVRDAKREADRIGTPFGHVCDPVGPGTERCMALVLPAVERGRARELVTSIATGVWSEALDVADDGDLQTLVERAGLDWQEARSHLSSDAWREMADRNRDRLLEIGLWGVPSFALGELSFWGQDRIWMIEDKIRRFVERSQITAAGVEPR
jgi:2-hydroxychromene-2-carboxylate isomerase